jgi:hypothetical protein
VNTIPSPARPSTWPAIAFPVLLLLVAPAHLVSVNIDSLGAMSPVAILPLLILAVILSAGLLLIVSLLRTINSEGVPLGILEFASYFVICTGLLLPLVSSPGMEDVAYLAVDWGNLGWSLGLAATALFLARRFPRTRVPMVVLIFAGLNLVVAFATIVSSYLRHPSPSEFANLSREKNILVFSLDGVSGSAARQVLLNNPELAAHFQGFDIFSHVASSSPATAASTFTSLRGNRNYKLEFQTEDELWDSAPEKLLTNVLLTRGWSVSAYGVYARKLHEPGKAWPSAPISPAKMLFLLNMSLARTVSPLYVIGGAQGGLVKLIFRMTWPGVGYPSGEGVVLAGSSPAPQWKQTLNADLPAMDSYLRNLAVGHNEPIAHFVHFAHTHYPVELDEDCRYRSSDEHWYKANQNWQGNVRQTTCALKQFARFIEELKQQDSFENALVVFKSDHGRPRAYYESQHIYSFAVRGHELWGLGRYEPFLAIKPLGPAAGPVTWRNEPALLDDLALTLCRAANGASDCGQYSGFDLLSSELRDVEQEQVSLFVVRSQASNFQFDSHSAVTFDRGKDIVRSLLAKLVDETLIENVACGESVSVADFPDWNNGHTDGRSWANWRDQESAFLRFRPNSDCLVLELSLRATEGSNPPSSVRVNGEPTNINWSKTEAGWDARFELPKLHTPYEVQVKPHENHSKAGFELAGFSYWVK